MPEAAPSSIITWYFQMKPSLAAVSVKSDATKNSICAHRAHRHSDRWCWSSCATIYSLSVLVPRLLWRISCIQHCSKLRWDRHRSLSPKRWKKGSNDRRLFGLAFNGILRNQHSGWVGQWLCESCRPRLPLVRGFWKASSLVHVELNGECLNRIWQKLGLDTTSLAWKSRQGIKCGSYIMKSHEHLWKLW